MSNRIGRQPSEQLLAFARSYRCSDCDSETGVPRLDSHGMWHIEIRHDDGCPVLTGVVSGKSAGLLAAAEAARIGGGGSVVYIAPKPQA